MLARLRHHRFVRRNHQQHRVDSTDAGEHVLDEAFVARHVHERDIEVPNPGVRETEIDRNAARFLFLQPIRISPRQGAHERALPVIDMAGRTDDD